MRDHRYTACAVLLIVVAAVWPVAASADDGHEEHAEESHHDGHAEAAGHGEDHHYRNGFALFLGATDESHHGTDFTIGLEYARRLSEYWAVGGLVDYVGADQRNWVLAPALFWQPTGHGLTFTVAPGVEYHDGKGRVEHDDDGHHLLKAADAHDDPDATYFVLRLGAAYWFHVGSRYGIGPSVNVDFVDGHEVWIYGVAFEVMF